MSIFRHIPGSYHDDSNSTDSSDGIFSGLSDSSNCTALPANAYTASPVVGSWPLQHFMAVVGGILAAVTVVICLGLATMHLLNYTNQQQQRQLIRALIVPAVFAIFSFLSIAFYDASYYLVPIADLYECFAVVAFFYYLIVIVTPYSDTRLAFFARLENKDKKGNITPGGSLKWFYSRNLRVFQLLPGRILATIATWIVEATMCHTGKHIHTALTIINVFNGVQTFVAVMSILAFYGRLKDQMDGHRIMFKLWTLKGIIFVQVVQRAVFSGLLTHDVLKASTYISYMDWNVGISNFATCCEMCLVSFIFIIPFSWTPYTSSGHLRGKDQKFFVRGVFDTWNVADILGGILFTVKLRSIVKSERFEDLPGYSAGNGEYEQQSVPLYGGAPAPSYQGPAQQYHGGNGYRDVEQEGKHHQEV